MWFLEQALSSFLGCIVGMIFSYLFFLFYTKQKFSGWKVVVKEGERECVKRNVGPKKAEQILDDQSDLSVFLKGIVSPYCNLKEDLMSEKARNTGLFQQRIQDKTWVIDISKNPIEPIKK